MAVTDDTGLAGGIHVRGLNELRLALRRLGPEWPRALTRAHKTIAEEGAHQARMRAAGMGGVQAKAASAIKGTATERAAKISVSASGALPMANVAFWGAKRHSGWYAKPQYASGPAQHPKWVGNSWEVAVASEGPYAINPALAAYMPYLLDDFTEMIDDLMREAFPQP